MNHSEGAPWVPSVHPITLGKLESQAQLIRLEPTNRLLQPSRVARIASRAGLSPKAGPPRNSPKAGLLHVDAPQWSGLRVTGPLQGVIQKPQPYAGVLLLRCVSALAGGGENS